MTGERRCGVRPLTSELVGLGWGEPHQYVDFGTVFMVYGPRDAHEVDVVVSIVEESLAFARDPAPADVRG